VAESGIPLAPAFGSSRPMLNRLDYLRAERANTIRLLDAIREAARRENNGAERARGRLAALEEVLARLDRLIGEGEAAAGRAP
jgi:hypothetical protein